MIAGSTLVFARSLYRSAKNYADNKKWETQHVLYEKRMCEVFKLFECAITFATMWLGAATGAGVGRLKVA